MNVDIGNWVAAALISGVILFLWTGFAQNVLPWGVKSVRTHPVGDGLGERLAQEAQSGMLFVVDQVAAFIALKPQAYYSLGRYFALEFVTQLLVGVILTALLAITQPLAAQERLLLVGLVGLAGIVSIDGQYWNWWGFSTLYTIGVAVNRLAGYLIASAVVIAFLLPS